MNFVLQVAIFFAAISLTLAVIIHLLLKLIFRKIRFWYAVPAYFLAIWCVLMYFCFIKEENQFPLFSDEYMIDLFNNNRADFEKLVHAYRTEYLLNDNSKSWDYSPESQEALKRLDIDYISHRSDMEWFENPYSPEVAKARFAKIGTPEFMEGWSARDKRMKGVVIHLNNSMKMSKRVGGDIVKTYLHLPMEPRIEDGKLLYPIGHSPEKFPQSYMPVVNSLNDYQEKWERGECFLKSIDAQWYLQLCRTN